MTPAPDATQLWLPPLALAGCVRATIVRDTRRRNLQGRDLENYFPASPLVTLMWWLEGEGEWLAEPGFSQPHEGHGIGPLMLAGPFTRPTHTRSWGPIHALQVMFLPEAFQALTGVEVAPLVNRQVAASTLLPADWTDWALTLHALPDDGARRAAIEAFLCQRWAAVAPQRGATQRYTEWVEALAVRAATSSAGRSLRQIERRVKAWAGVPMRELRAVSRGERAFLAAVAGEGEQAVNWAEIAADTEYADQSHLCRETRRLAGFSPEDLRQRILAEEAFWIYRLWR